MKENNKRYALILAGGKGSRLWPISTTNKPKQYLNLYSNNIMINETIKRLESIFEYDNIFVITNIDQKELEQRGNGTITILSSDHYIDETEKLLNNIEEGIELANKEENLVTIGIKPTYPATGFGYIKYNYDDDLKCNIVEEFKEKPIYEKAREYIESEKYYWNSGMFIWKITSILKNYKEFLPEIYKYKEQIANSIRNGKDVLQNIYKDVESISIDKGILEKSNKIKMVKGEFNWLDIGSINDFFKIQEKDFNNNVKKGNLIAEDIENCSIYNDDNSAVIAVVGVKDLNIINSNNVILIANKDKMGELPNLIEKIKCDKELKKYL